MSEQFVKIEGKIEGADRVKEMINRAPEVYRKAVLGWLLKERNSFVGDGKKDGVFRKKLLRKKTVRGGTWETKVARIFKGWIGNGEKLGMYLEMGFPTTKKRKIHEILETLTKSHSVTSTSYMPTPVYKNLAGVKNTYKFFKRKSSLGELTVVRDAEKILFFDKKGSKDLLFVGVKKIYIKKQFDFQYDWSKRLPNAIERYQKAIDKATLKVENNNG